MLLPSMIFHAICLADVQMIFTWVLSQRAGGDATCPEVTGGTGALGLVFAEWMSSLGARQGYEVHMHWTPGFVPHLEYSHLPITTDRASDRFC